MNFLEGTRFTPAKHAKQQSPYRHLLKPKAGGIALALNAMGDKFRAILDVTIVYPDGAPGFMRFPLRPPAPRHRARAEPAGTRAPDAGRLRRRPGGARGLRASGSGSCGSDKDAQIGRLLDGS
jgi:1-acyl-sn-glycerol-3-phosphate acyltransferase